MPQNDGGQGTAKAQLVQIVGNHVSCSVCGRSLLTGEWARVVADNGTREVVCRVCQLGVTPAADRRDG